MILKEINFSTGPVALHPKVKQALCEAPVSHRSEEFSGLSLQLTRLYKKEFHINEVCFLTGSGTTANEAMLQQIRMRKEPGLILSNGEFGNRLIKQATTIGLEFSTYKKLHGGNLDADEVENLFKKGDIHWLLFTHCETSTGIVNNLEALCSLCNKYNVLCFVDCISSVAAFRIDLSQVAMATASSGKGLCGIAGIAMIFSNIKTVSDGTIPTSLDLTNYGPNKIPFTISSTLLNALFTGSVLKLNNENYHRIKEGSRQIGEVLAQHSLKTFNASSHVFTIISALQDDIHMLAGQLKNHRVTTSYKSEYLQKNNWLQIALFGIYTDVEMLEGVDRFKSLLSGKVLSHGSFNMNAIQ